MVAVLMVATSIGAVETKKQTIDTEKAKTSTEKMVIEKKQITLQVNPVTVSPSEIETDARAVPRFQVTNIRMAPTSRSANYELVRRVFSSGVLKGSSASYQTTATSGEPLVGGGSSASLQCANGFWPDYSGGGCCIGIRGNANGDEGESLNISDITYLVDYLFGIPLGSAPPCQEEGNANGDLAEQINISDITYLVEYLFGIPLGPAPPACP